MVVRRKGDGGGVRVTRWAHDGGETAIRIRRDERGRGGRLAAGYRWFVLLLLFSLFSRDGDVLLLVVLCFDVFFGGKRGGRLTFQAWRFERRSVGSALLVSCRPRGLKRHIFARSSHGS